MRALVSKGSPFARGLRHFRDPNQWDIPRTSPAHPPGDTIIFRVWEVRVVKKVSGVLYGFLIVADNKLYWKIKKAHTDRSDLNADTGGFALFSHKRIIHGCTGASHQANPGLSAYVAQPHAVSSRGNELGVIIPVLLLLAGGKPTRLEMPPRIVQTLNKSYINRFVDLSCHNTNK